MSRVNLLVVMIAGVLMVAACGGGDDSVDDAVDAPASTTTASTSTGAEPTEATDGAVDDSAEAEDPPPSSTTTEPAELSRSTGTLIYGDLDVVGLELTDSGVVGRPLIAWAAVDGADSYEIIVATQEGQWYWSWFGSGTEVPVGGSPLLGEASAGVRLLPGMTIRMVARDASGMPLSQSEIVEVR